MMQKEKPLIPLSILRELRCKNCGRFVTCGPVLVLLDETLLCGRCQTYEAAVYRNLAYEAIASMFLYPCYNWEKYCSRSLQWNDSLEHEPDCAYTDCCSRFWRRGMCCRGRRAIPYGDIRLTAVSEHLLESIKCVQCESYLSCEPVFVMTNGKNICHRCIYSNGPPPSSRRNSMYELLSSIMIFPCVYRNRGCPTRLKFGRDLWQHESECSYNQMFKKAPKNPNKKERGVITTHSGHTYGTITPNSLLFAPPNPRTEFDMNKEILKSLKKHQERKVVSADQIGSQLVEKYSEDGSVDTDCSSSDKRNSYKEASTGGHSPIRLEDKELKQRYSVYQANMEKRDSGYVSERHPAHFIENVIIAQIHQENNKSPYPNFSPNGYSSKADPDPDYDQETRTSPSPYAATDEQRLNFRNSDVQGLAYRPSFKGVQRSESMLSNRQLIQELKVRQKVMRSNSMKNDVESPYKQCNNLEDVMQMHDNIAK